jgi:hypothetical protein
MNYTFPFCLVQSSSRTPHHLFKGCLTAVLKKGKYKTHILTEINWIKLALGWKPAPKIFAPVDCVFEVVCQKGSGHMQQNLLATFQKSK